MRGHREHLDVFVASFASFSLLFALPKPIWRSHASWIPMSPQHSHRHWGFLKRLQRWYLGHLGQHSLLGLQWWYLWEWQLHSLGPRQHLLRQRQPLRVLSFIVRVYYSGMFFQTMCTVLVSQFSLHKPILWTFSLQSPTYFSIHPDWLHIPQFNYFVPTNRKHTFSCTPSSSLVCGQKI